MRLLNVISVEKAFKIINQSFTALESEEVSLNDAGGRWTAEVIVASEDVPSFERSTVDGYAVRAAETFGAQESLPSVLELAGSVKMGEAAGEIQPGQCCYVPTGGMLPKAANAVVMIEETQELSGIIHIYRQVAPGENMIKRGEDLRQEQQVLPVGRRLRSPELGLLASLGINSVKVVRRPVVGVFSTGDELVPIETQILSPGRVRDSNGIALAYLTKQVGAEAIAGGIIGDSFEDFYMGLSRMLETVDMLVLSGGSSVGDRDFTPAVMQKLSGGELLIEGLAIQPGKPTLLANCNGKPILGLPGHPISALNIYSLFGRALIRRLAGATDEGWRPSVRATLTRNIPSRPGRTDMVRVALSESDQGIKATPVFGRSGLLRTLAEADGIIEVKAESDGLLAGAEVKVYIWD